MERSGYKKAGVSPYGESEPTVRPRFSNRMRYAIGVADGLAVCFANCMN
jgi:hypothetical protein